MAKRKDYSQQYKKARANFMRRRREWITKYHYYVEAPKIPQAPTRKDIQQLEKLRIKNFTQKQVKQFKTQYDIAYDAKVPWIANPETAFIPPTEEDFYADTARTFLERNAQYQTEPVESESEILADLSSLIDGIIEESNKSAISWQINAASETDETLKAIFNSAVQRVGNRKSYLVYLEDPDTHAQLVEAATQAKYQSGGSKEETAMLKEAALVRFATILNAGQPISLEQSEELTMGNMSFDFTDSEFDE